MGAFLTMCWVLFGCCANLVFLELLMKEDPGGGNLVTFLQFSYIALDGLIFTSKFGTVQPKVGLKTYVILVILFFVSSVLNNYAFNFNIPMPLHMIFRSGSLIANMAMGIMILKKKYTMDKYLSVIMITVGVTICTIASGKEVKSTAPGDLNAAPTTADFFWWSVGIVILTVALFVSARMGIYQETLFSKYGKVQREALYYSHLIPLPFFIFLAPNLYEHGLIAVNSSRVTIPLINLAVPGMILSLIGNVLTQYMCVSSVFSLTTECTSLTVTLVLTLRKFFSLVFSIFYFSNPFTYHHWIGTLLVFVGTILFTEVVPKVLNSLLAKNTSEKKVK